MSDYLAPPPVVKLISVTRGCDRSFSLERIDTAGDAVNFAAGTTVYMWIDIDKANPTKVDASVNGSLAAFTIPSEVCDLVRSGTRWRAVLDLGELEVPLVVGKFERNDG